MSFGQGECRRLRVKETLIESFRQVNQFNSNALGILHGGVMITWLIDAASVAAARAARGYAALAGIDFLLLLSPVRVGEHLDIKAWVGASGRSSLEVGAAAVAESGGRQRLAAAAHMTMVALDSSLKPRPSGVCVEPGGGETAWELSLKLREARRPRLEAKRLLASGKLPEPRGLGCTTTISHKIVNPGDSVAYNIMHAGNLLLLLDELAAIHASSCASGIVVTGGVFDSDFITPIHVGEVLRLEARSVSAGKTSILVELRTRASTMGEEHDRLAARSFFRMVHIGGGGKPEPLPRKPEGEPEPWAAEMDSRFRSYHSMAKEYFPRILEELSPK